MTRGCIPKDDDEVRPLTERIDVVVNFTPIRVKTES